MSEIKNNIEMNIKESSGSYRSLYPVNDSFTKVQTLTSLVCDVMGIPETSTPADAFLSLALGLNSYGYYITFLYPDGSPVVNAIVTGATGISGEQLVTDSNGQVLAVSESQSISVSIAQNQIPYFDIQALSNYSISSVGKVTNSVVNLSQKSEDYQLVTSSQELTFSGIVDNLDITAVGGGGNGTVDLNYKYDKITNVLSGGGGGGYVETVLGKQINNITIIIGARGGGDTSVNDFLQARGGENGSQQTPDGSQYVAGGSGNGDGGRTYGGFATGSVLSNGENGVGYIFNDSNLGLAGGGGGGGYQMTDIRNGGALPENLVAFGIGGKPFGGAGIIVNHSGSITIYRAAGSGSRGGGGSGGLVSFKNNTVLSSKQQGAVGGAGCVYIRWHNKT